MKGPAAKHPVPRGAMLLLEKKDFGPFASGPFLPDLLQPDLSCPGPFVARPFVAGPFAAGPFEDGRFVGVSMSIPGF